MKTKKLGQQIVVTVENDGTEDVYLNVTDTAEEAAEHGVKKRALPPARNAKELPQHNTSARNAMTK